LNHQGTWFELNRRERASKANYTVYCTGQFSSHKSLICKEKLPSDYVENPRVDGSIPSQATKQKPLLSQEGSGFFFAVITRCCSSRLT
jgi:hypothetical protein